MTFSLPLPSSLLKLPIIARGKQSIFHLNRLLERSKPKSTQYKDKWAIDVFRNWQAAREKKFRLLEPGSVFKGYDVHRVQSLEERLEDLDSLEEKLI